MTGATGGVGFGKTSLARLVAQDRRIWDLFSDGVVWVSVGADTMGPRRERALGCLPSACLVDGLDGGAGTDVSVRQNVGA